MVMLEWPMMYCNAFGFIPAFANRVQNVCRMVWGVMFGSLIFGVVQMGIFYTGIDTDWFFAY